MCDKLHILIGLSRTCFQYIYLLLHAALGQTSTTFDNRSKIKLMFHLL